MEDLLKETKLLVREWHRKFKLEPITKIEEIESFIDLRKKLFIEEFDEYNDAGPDIIERADAITDMLYIISGTEELLERVSDEIFTSRAIFDFLLWHMGSQVTLEKLIDLDINKIIRVKITELFTEVNRSNWSKLGEDGEPIINGENGFFDERKPKGKLLKGPNFFEPNIKKVLFG